MKCPFCAHVESKVTDSRLSAVGDVTRRRRECEKCARRFTTYERVEEVLPLVVKRDGRREAFDRAKLLGGLRRACEKRSVPSDRLEQIVDAVERELMDAGEKEVSAISVGETVMAQLRILDDIAYVRFASVYRSFRDLDELREELEKMARTRSPVTDDVASGERATRTGLAMDEVPSSRDSGLAGEGHPPGAGSPRVKQPLLPNASTNGAKDLPR